MQKDNQKKNNFFKIGKSIIEKIVVLSVIMILIGTALSAAFIQNQESRIPQKNPGRSIVWDVTMNFTNPGGQNDYVMFGEAPDATDGPPADIYDVAKPPAPMLPYIRAFLKDNLPSPYTNLWRDYRQYPDTAKVWNLSIKWEPEDGETPSPITITWSTAEVDDSEYTSVDFCTNAGAVLKNMLVDTTYTFTCPASVTQNFKIICSAASINNPPVFGTPSPANGSTGNLLSLSWSIPISDPEGNSFNWWIQCSNGQTNTASGATNGTKSLSLSGLAYLTTYKVWVNATDPTGSGLYTRRWFTFTTKAQNFPPVFGTPSPVNGSTGNLLSLTWSIAINDPEGNTFTWTIQCSNGQTNTASGAANGTKTLSLSGLAYSTLYKVWVNATDPTGSGIYTRKWYTFTTKANLPPVFGTPSPTNGSTGNLLSLTWSISINDPEGNLISWTIQCSNGQTNSGTNAANGTRSLTLSGLAYLTTYKVWVNATDPTGSSLYTRRWFTFTTKQLNNPPVFGAPSPANSSTNNPLSLTWSIPINDPEGNTFTWTIQCSNGQTNTASGATNGTKTLTLSGLAYSTLYKIWVNATDPTGSGLYTRRWYTFTTKANLPPVFGTPSPVNGSTGNLLSLTWSIPISDPEGNSFNWWIQCSNGQTNTASGATNGTKSLSLSGLAYLTTYKVWVNATDPTGSNTYTRRWYIFTTKAQNLPPVFGTPTPANGSASQPLSLTWSIPINDPEGNSFNWWIQCSNGQTNSATGASNGTKTLALTGLAYSTLYKVWVNATDPTGSGTYTRKWYTFTTKANLPPVFGTPSPVNGSTGNLLSLTWSIPINDPEGNAFTWTIQCSNGQVSSGSGASNGTKSLALSGLAYLTTYKVWVNATDPTGSGLYTRRWFTFTTKAQNFPPVFGTPSPVNGSASQPLSLTWSIPINDPEGNTFTWTIQCSNGQTSTASGAANGTKTLALSGLAYSTLYKVWVNATDPTGSGIYTRKWYTFTTKANLPPVFGTPSPTNGSTGNLLSLTWSIPINDPEGNLISWTIQCSNGQTNSGTNAANGTRSLTLSGLAYLTTYKVWVNATDPTGSNTYTRRWYTFTTKAQNFPPVFGTPSPANGSASQPLSLTWSIPINDPEGNTFTWTIQCSNGQTNTASGAANGTKTLTLSGLAYSTTYKIWVNATDPTGSNTYTRKWYTFTTKDNLPPVFGTPTPANGSTNQPLNLNWSIPISDSEGDQFSWTIQCSNGQTNSGSGASNGTKSLSLTGLAYSTAYKVWVNATDPTGSNMYTRNWYSFTTQQQQNLPPNKPNKPSGPTSGKINVEYTYTTNTTDPNSDQVYYNWSWGDGTYSGWLGPYASGAPATASHIWSTKGTYSITVKAKDTFNAESSWSDPLDITVTTEFSVQIKGGFGVKMVITNTGTSDATGVTWQIHVQGGILKLINKTKSGTIDIPAGTSKTVSTGLILGLGGITISTQVAGNEKTANGFVLFFFVLGVKENASLNNWFSR